MSKSMAELRLQNVSAAAGDAALVKNASARLSAGEFVALVGPNGAGKTSLIKSALGLIAPTTGDITIDGAPVAALSPPDRARRIAYLPQMRPLAWPVRVRDVVALGRYAYGASLSKLRGEDAKAVEQALRDCDLANLADRRTDTLSGGELARVHCARAFATQAPLLLADEPIASLDPSHQFAIMALMRAYVDRGRGALAVLHDIALAARFADRFIWMKDGEIIADGPPAETLTTERMRSVFDVDANVSFDAEAPAVAVNGPA